MPPPAALPYAHREPYADYFARLAAAPDPAAALRRLITHIDAALDGPEQLSLWQALWQTARRLTPAKRRAVGACLDGRHAPALQLLDQPWDAPALIDGLLALPRPVAAQAAWAPALLQHHGLDPLAEPALHPPRRVLLAARAAIDACAGRLAPEAIARLQAAALDASAREPALLPMALALLFELALHAADEDTATAALAELLRHGHADRLRPDRVRAWLDGTAFSDDEDLQLPLLLAPALQVGWLRPAGWSQAAPLLALHAALQRPAPRRRLEAMASLLVDGDGPATAAPALPQAAAEVLQALQALDTAYALIEQGGDAEPLLHLLMRPDILSAPAIAAIHRGSARWAAQRADAEGELLALLRARHHQATPALRTALSHKLPAPAPALGPDWRDELPYWNQLKADPAWQDLATYQLATLCTNGCLEPHPPRRCQDLDRAHTLWTRLAARPRYAALAAAALRQPAQTLWRPALQHQCGVDHLWFECPGARAVTIVFSCIATHHSYAEVASLRGRLPGQHLMFVRCPDKNWYSDNAFVQLRALLQARVASRFAATEVSCWYGSMGGHGALKFALEFGWRAIVFNPQTDLDLWAAFRPRERALLWGARRHARLSDWPLAAWEKVPLYVACGADTADREALSVMLDRLRRCAELTAIIEKFDDPHHAGLMNRLAAGPVAGTLQRVMQRLRQLEQAAPAPGAVALEAADADAWWDRLDRARALKVEIQVRQGRLWWQPSRACGTRGDASAPAARAPGSSRPQQAEIAAFGL